MIFSANNDKYIGDWKDDRFHGSGIYIFQNGERYDGTLKCTKKMNYNWIVKYSK